MVRSVRLSDPQELPSSGSHSSWWASSPLLAVGFTQLVTPLLSTAVVAHAFTSWHNVPALLHEGASPQSISSWAKKYSTLGGKGQLAAVGSTVLAGIQTAVNLPFESFSRFYFILGTASTTVYFLFTPLLKYQLAKLAEYGDMEKGSTDPKRDLLWLLRVHAVSTLFAVSGLGFYCYGVYNAVNNL
ncbi:CYFA0S10e02828g1_1 [Cyberlindnera fabianii]|uniref:CYFA0S10e02828g1_1 n=1 Tax=Cyberlindnera fabianii TaxID=36022 RepID=A0A061AZ40_CYBFA|nr:hypothetical protein BON22_3138 [Cyberlindnera fabianii]CDR42833.1 CYFA0S10e02828g1_1 [Cyberlindnera fabianii]